MNRVPPAQAVLRGMALIAIGRPEGLAEFQPSRQAFLASFVPLCAMPLIGFFMMLPQGLDWPSLTDLAAGFAGLLAPPVLSHALARRYGRGDHWLRYAVAFNWCQWLLPVMLLLFLALLTLADRSAAWGVLPLLAFYGFWLHWFLARHGLALGWARSVFMVLGVNGGTALLLVLPRALAMLAEQGR